MEINLTQDVMDSWQVLQDYDKITVVPIMYQENYDLGDYERAFNDNTETKSERQRHLNSLTKIAGLGMSCSFNPKYIPIDKIIRVAEMMSNNHAEAQIQKARREGIGGFDYQGLLVFDGDCKMLGCVDNAATKNSEIQEGTFFASNYTMQNYNDKYNANQLSK